MNISRRLPFVKSPRAISYVSWLKVTDVSGSPTSSDDRLKSLLAYLLVHMIIYHILVLTFIFPFTAIVFVLFTEIFKLYFTSILFSAYTAVYIQSSVLSTITWSSLNKIIRVFRIKSFAKTFCLIICSLILITLSL
jgi:hypothetical protein